MDSEDRKLIVAFRRGEQSAFAALVIKYRRTVYRVARRMTGNHEDAADVVQDTFVRAFRGLRSFEGTSSLRTWLYRIAVNASLDHLVRTARAPVLVAALPDRPAPPDDGPGEIAERRERGRQIAAAVEALPPRQRAAVVLRLYLDLPYAEIANIMDCSEGTVKATVFAALRKLRQKLRHLVTVTED
ncbi:MAG: sigma-70 family RNA polymerase sigma factor [Armatimonadota bacterium]|nr:sigma-70 family RNA polymerase sigma factor [Armatimonadota bacterium]MDR5696276.1 sigma-70 family RNA polymerase sigma factor [Armatimonadota bacterium]